jgi:nucleoside-diphosphate-sugar epimerase
MNIAITGSNGYLGGHLALFLAERGHQIQSMGRAQGFGLGQPVQLPESTDALIHCAYDFKAFGEAANDRTNVQGSIALFKKAHAVGIRKLVFISSMAAFPGCKSIYGRGKLAVENAVRELGVLSIRPGTIHGAENKGIFGTLKKLASLPVVPLPGGGGQGIYLVHIDDLCEAICRLALDGEPQTAATVALAHPEKTTLREIINRLNGSPKPSIPVPASLLLPGLKFLEFFLKGRSPVRSDSLVSLLNPSPNPNFDGICCGFRPFG